MTLSRLLVAAPALFLFSDTPALAGETIPDGGALACVTDTWAEKEPEKGHKLVDFVGRCIAIPDDPAKPKYTEECTAKYDYLPDQSWTGRGSCTATFKGGGTFTDTFEEGSQLKDYAYTITGGTGKYAGARGGGTYSYDNLTDTLAGGRYRGTIILP